MLKCGRVVTQSKRLPKLMIASIFFLMEMIANILPAATHAEQY